MERMILICNVYVWPKENIVLYDYVEMADDT